MLQLLRESFTQNLGVSPSEWPTHSQATQRTAAALV